MSERLPITFVVLTGLALLLTPSIQAQRAIAPPIRTTASSPAYQRFLSPASPIELVAARKVDRIAWTSFEEGQRNAYTASAPSFVPVRLTNFMTDNGVDLSGIRISDDGSTVIFQRGTAPNREGWVANPTADPDGPERAVWAARTTGGRVARRPRRVEPGAGAGRQLCTVRQGWPDLPRARVIDGAGDGNRPRRKTVHHSVGRTERTEVVARRTQDRIRQHADRPQFHHGVRPGDADCEVHVAEC
jgi:hypothetical protein